MLRKLLAIVLLVASCAVGQNRLDYRMVNVQGALQSALSLNPQSVVRREVGSLRPPGVLTLNAVIAIDQTSKAEVRGLEVKVEGDDIWNGNRHCKKTVYIDEAALPEFEFRLAMSVKSESTDQRRSEIPSVALAGNRLSSNSEATVYYVPLMVGWYWTGDRYGLYVGAPYDGKSRHDSCQFNMPQADVSELLTFVQKGHEWLKKPE